MGRREEYLNETITLLKEHYDAKLSEIIDAYHGETTIPATIYDNELTPLEATVSYLADIRGQTTNEIAQQLRRPHSTITSAHENARKKRVILTDDPHTPYRIPLTAFSKNLSPAESIVYQLKAQGLRNSEIADVLGKDPRNIWQLNDRAEKKLGESA